MNPSTLDKYLRKDAAGPLADRLDDFDIIDDLGCVGVLRGVKEKSPSLELRRKTGHVLVVAYGSGPAGRPSESKAGTSGRNCGRIFG